MPGACQPGGSFNKSAVMTNALAVEAAAGSVNGAELPPIYFCAVTEHQMARAGKWRKTNLVYALAPALMPFREGFIQAFKGWSDVCGLNFSPGNFGEPADITLTYGTIDGPSGILAWSELPDGSDRGLLQKYDAGEGWVIAINPGNRQIDIVAVGCHEIGHAIGLDHAQVGTGDLMEPTYKPGKRFPQPGDIRRAVALYGGPGTPPVSPPTVPPTIPGEPDEMHILSKGVITSKWKLTRTA